MRAVTVLRSTPTDLYAELVRQARKSDNGVVKSDIELAARFNVNERTVRRWLKVLELVGYVRFEYDYVSDTREIARRRIYINQTEQLGFLDNTTAEPP